MSEEFHHLQKLVDLAREPSSLNRRLLLREVTDLFLEAPEDLSEGEVDQFSDVMGRVAFDLEMEVRQELADRLAQVTAAPRELVVRLANDEIEVARTVLERSGVFQSADLLAIVEDRGQGHLLAISKRQTVSEGLADALVEKGDDGVLESLARNDGAVLSRRAMEVMVTRSEHNTALHEPLVSRRDLPPDLMHEMFFWVSSALREYILSATTDIDESRLDSLLAETQASIEGPAVQDEDPAWRLPRRFIDQNERRRELTPSLVVDLLRQKKMPAGIIGFARLAGIDEPTAQRVILRADAEALAVACKASGFDRDDFCGMIRITTKDSGAETELLDLYDKLTLQTAQRTMRFWRTRRQARR